MDGSSSPPARGPQDGPNVHHGLSLMSQSLIFCICPGFTDKQKSLQIIEKCSQVKRNT
jgi:hypothetical protein